MFYWMYFTTSRVNRFENRPLIIWLQGGPGASGTGYGNFEEIGPLDLFTKPRNHTWVRNYNILFIDNPVGTGWSYVDDNKLLTKTNYEIAEDLVNFMREFYKLYPEFEEVPLHIFSESYGGKMAAEFGYLLDQEIKAGKINCYLESVGLGNSWISPIDSTMSWAEFLFQAGMVDIDGYRNIDASAKSARAAVKAKQWTLATSLWAATELVVLRETDGVDFYNVMTPIRKNSDYQRRLELYRNSKYVKDNLVDLSHFDAEDRDRMLEDLMNGPVSEILKMNQTWKVSSGPVFSALTGDFMKPVTDIVAKLLDETDVKVVVFSGQLDVIVATPGTIEWVNNLPWKGLDDYKKAERTSVAVDGYIEAYLRQHGNLYVYWLNRAGHMSPADNPKAMDCVLKEIAGY